MVENTQVDTLDKHGPVTTTVQKGIKHLIHALGHGGDRAKMQLTFKAAPSHSVRDEMGGARNLPDGYFINGCVFNYQPMTMAARLLGQDAHDTVYNADGSFFDIRRKVSGIPNIKIVQALEAAMKQFGVNDPHATCATKDGVWISSSALQEMIKGRYLLNFQHHTKFTRFMAETADGNDVVGRDLVHLLTGALKAQEIDPEQVGISGLSSNALQCAALSEEQAGRVIQQVGIGAVVSSIENNVMSSLVRRR